MGAISWDDVPVEIQDPVIGEIRSVEVGEMTLELGRVNRGLNTAEMLKGLPDDMCQSPHWGFLVKGKFRFRTKDGEETVEAGQAYYAPPGHIVIVDEDCEVVDFSPTEQRRVRMKHFAKKLARG